MKTLWPSFVRTTCMRSCSLLPSITTHPASTISCNIYSNCPLHGGAIACVSDQGVPILTHHTKKGMLAYLLLTYLSKCFLAGFISSIKWLRFELVGLGRVREFVARAYSVRPPSQNSGHGPARKLEVGCDVTLRRCIRPKGTSDPCVISSSLVHSQVTANPAMADSSPQVALSL